MANELEAAGTRLAANVNVDRFRTSAPVAGALADFQGTQPDDALRQAYNRAVRHYEKDRSTTLHRPVAAALGFDPRPLFLLG